MKARAPIEGPGWVYALTGFGETGKLIKVGVTSNLPFVRAYVVKRTVRPKPSGHTSLWAAITDNRMNADRGVKLNLKRFTSKQHYSMDANDCREIYAAPLWTVLRIIREVTGAAPIRFHNWEQTRAAIDCLQRGGFEVSLKLKPTARELGVIQPFEKLED